MADQVTYYVDSDSSPPQDAPYALYKIVRTDKGTTAYYCHKSSLDWTEAARVVSAIGGSGGDIYYEVSAKDADDIIGRWRLLKSLFRS